MTIKGKIHQAEISILNIYSPNTNTPMFIKDTLLQLKSHFDPHILISGIFSTSPSPIDKSLRQKLNRQILELTDIINQMYLMDIYRKFHPNRKEHKESSAKRQVHRDKCLYKKLERSHTIEGSITTRSDAQKEYMARNN